MTVPVVESAVTSRSTANATSHTVTLPDAMESGEWILVILGSDGSGVTFTPPNGDWEEVLAHPNLNTVSVAAFVKVAVGDEDNSTVAFGSSASERVVAHAYRISSPPTSTACVVGTAGYCPLAVPSLRWSHGARDTLFIAGTAASASGAISSAAPTGFASEVKNSAEDEPTNNGVQMATYRKSESASSGLTLSEDWMDGVGYARFVLALIESPLASDAYDAPAPHVVGALSTLFNSDATAHVATIPQGMAGDDLFAVVSFDNAGSVTVTTPSGWTLRSATSAGKSNLSGVYHKVSDGEESTVDFVTSGSEQGAVQIYRVRLASEFIVVGYDRTDSPNATPMNLWHGLTGAGNLLRISGLGHSSTVFPEPGAALADPLGFREFLRSETTGSGASGNLNSVAIREYGITDTRNPVPWNPGNVANQFYFEIVCFPQANDGTLSGRVTLDSEAVEGATIVAVMDGLPERRYTAETDAQGDYSIAVPLGQTYHVTVEFDDGEHKYNAPSLWGVEPVAA